MSAICRHPKALISPEDWNSHRGLIMCPDCGVFCSPACGNPEPLTFCPECEEQIKHEWEWKLHAHSNDPQN